MSRIFVLHENPAWLGPFAEAFDRLRLPWSEWFLHEGAFDLSVPPPEGVFYNRISASSHTRDHRFSAELTAAILAWLVRHGRRVVNGPNALDLEISKARQYAALEAAGITVPRTVAVAGAGQVVSAARQHFPAGPVLLKPNRGGKGLGVRLFQSADSLEAYLNGPDYEAPVDGLHLLQEYVRAPEPVITRAEFVGGRFLYAVQVDTSNGFELCPSEACAVPQARPQFRITAGVEPSLRTRLETFLASAGIEVAGIELITDERGRTLAYDVNTNTNYNPEAERAAGLVGTDRSGPGAIAAFLGAELSRLYREAA